MITLAWAIGRPPDHGALQPRRARSVKEPQRHDHHSEFSESHAEKVASDLGLLYDEVRYKPWFHDTARAAKREPPAALQQPCDFDQTAKHLPSLVVSFPYDDEPGTATRNQIMALEQYGIIREEEGPALGKRVASLALSAVQYAEGVWSVITGLDEPMPSAIRVMTVHHILSDDTLRNYVDRWGRGRYLRGTHRQRPRFQRHEYFRRVAAKIEASVGDYDKEGNFRRLLETRRAAGWPR